MVRASCEDGRDFIKRVVGRAKDHPFPAYTGPKLSKMQEKEQKRRLQLPKSSPASAIASVDQSTGIKHLSPRQAISHFVMNLPDSAIDFLDCFRGIFSGSAGERDLSGIYTNMPMVHCHCFTRELQPDMAEADIRQVIFVTRCKGRTDCDCQRVESKLGHKLEEVTLHMVRSVAPNKDMYCISFRLPRDVAFA